MKNKKIFRGLFVLGIILTTLALLSSLFIHPFFNLLNIFNNHEAIRGSFQSLFGTLAVGFLVFTYANYWNFKNIEQQNALSKGSVALGVDSENIFTIYNKGKLPIKIDRVSSIINIYQRKFGVQKRLVSEFKNNRESVVEDIAHRNLDISSGESIVLALEQTGIEKGIEEYEFILQIIKIEYTTTTQNKYKKYYGICRLTGPTSWFRYQISHLNNVNENLAINMMNARGKYYIDNLLADFIYQEAIKTKYNEDLFPDEESKKSVVLSHKKYMELINTKTDVPQDRWIIFRSEEEEII